MAAVRSVMRVRCVVMASVDGGGMLGILIFWLEKTERVRRGELCSNKEICWRER